MLASRFYAEADYRDKRNSQSVRTKLSTASSLRKRISKESLFQKRLSSRALDAYFKRNHHRKDTNPAAQIQHNFGSTVQLRESQLNLSYKSNELDGGGGGKTPSLGTATIENRSSSSNMDDGRKAPVSLKVRLVRRFMRLLFSSIGLVLVVTVYAVFGALMFQLLEYHEELRVCEEGQGKYFSELKHLRETLKGIGTNLTATEFLNRVDRLKQFSANPALTNASDAHQYSLARSSNSSAYAFRPDHPQLSTSSSSSRRKYEYHDPNVLIALGGNFELLLEIEERIDDLLREFRTNILLIETKYKYHGQNCTADSRWKFFPAVLYCVTIISTVGYGFITPLTWEGRIVTICYASIGIPCFLLCLTSLSGSMANVFRSIYYKIDQMNPIKNYLLKRKALKKLRKKEKKRAARMPNAATSSSIVQQTETTQVPVTVGDESKAKKKSPSEIAGGGGGYYEFALKTQESFGSVSDSDDDDDEDDEESDYEYAEASEVPFFMSLIVILLYVTAGGYTAKAMEGWTLGQSIYFVYVTVSTMGFGDFVPGMKKNDKLSDVKLVMASMNCLFGMAIVGMCFSMMQRVTRRYLARVALAIKDLLSCTMCHPSSPVHTEDEHEQIMSRIRMLKQYDEMLNLKRRKTASTS